MKSVGRVCIAFAVLIFFGALPFPPAEGAAGVQRLALSCVASHLFLREIYNCGQNSVAVRYGELCAQQLLAGAKANGAALHARMEELKTKLGNAQERSLADAAQRLRMAISDLSFQIANFQRNTDLVASYTNAMIDFSGGVDDATSAECFSTNFHKLQGVVDRLDKEIVQSLDARAAATSMLQTLMGGVSSLESTVVSRKVEKSGNQQALPLPSVSRGQNGATGSDITGVQEERKKAEQKIPPAPPK